MREEDNTKKLSDSPRSVKVVSVESLSYNKKEKGGQLGRYGSELYRQENLDFTSNIMIIIQKLSEQLHWLI